MAEMLKFLKAAKLGFLFAAVLIIFLTGVTPIDALGKFGRGLPARVELDGVLRLVGNEPFTELVLSGFDGIEWYLDKNELEKCTGLSAVMIRTMVGKAVIAHGEPYTEELMLANKQKVGTRYRLRNISFFDLAEADPVYREKKQKGREP